MVDRRPKPTMIYTPLSHIPIGEALKTEMGEYAIRIKKPKSDETETISLGLLVSQIVQSAQIRETQE